MITFNNIQELKVAYEAGTITTPQFVSIRNYRNQHGEVSNYLINLGVSYKKVVERDLMLMQFVDVNSFEFDSNIPQNVRERAFNELLESLSANSKDSIDQHTNASSSQIELYNKVIQNVKQHIHNEMLYLHGMLIKKTVVTPGEYPQRNKRILTRAKDTIRRVLSTSKYRHFFLSNITNIKINGKELILEL